jgi:hypothetical protein
VTLVARGARRQLIVAGALAAMLVIGLVVNRFGGHAQPATQVAAAAGPPLPGPEGAGAVDPRRDRTQEGARAATLAYAAGVQQDVVYQPDAEARAVLAGWMAGGVDPAEVDRTAAELETTRKALMASRGQVWWVVSPLAAKVGSFTPDRAQVSVWLVKVLASGRAGGGGGFIPTSGWLTATVDLVWDAERGWSVWGTTSTPGPVPGPTVGERPATSEEFTRSLDRFSLVREHR